MCSNVIGQTVITLERSGGILKIPCVINGLKINMVFDTGASYVTISMEMARELYLKGKLKDEDFLGIGKSCVANGNIIDHLEINLKTICIGSYTLKNTRAIIISGQNAPLLLGLSAISKLGKITLDGNKLLISDNSNKHNGVRNQVADCIMKKDYGQAITLLHKLEESETLNTNDICDLVLCYSKNHQYDECLRYCTHWIEQFDHGQTTSNRQFIYEEICCCSYELNAYEEAIYWITRLLPIILSDDLKSHYIALMGSCYFFLSEFDKCLNYYYQSTKMRLKYLGYTEFDVQNNKVQDKILGEWYQRLFLNYSLLTNNKERTYFFVKMGAKCGNKESKEFCNYANINYK